MPQFKTLSLTLLWALVISQFAYGQQQKVDSLNKLLQSDIADTVKAKVYLDLGDVHRNDSVKFNTYLNKALKLSQRIGYQRGIIDFHNDQGLYFRRRDNYKKAIENYKKALTLSQKIKDYKRVANAYNNLGVAYDYSNNFPTALDYYQKSLKLSQKIDFKDGIIRAYDNQGIVYEIMGETKKALEYYKKSLNVKHPNRKEISLAPTYHNIGNVYDILGDYPKAIDYYQKAIKIEKKHKAWSMLASTTSNLGGIYRTLGNYVKALESYQQAIKLSQKVKNKRGLAQDYDKTGVIYEHDLKDYTKALEYYKKALDLQKSIDNQRGMAYALVNIGNVQHTLKNYEQALTYHEQALELYTKTKEKGGVANVLNNIGKIYQSQKEYKKALDYLYKSLTLKKEIDDKLQLANTYNNLGHTYILLKQYSKSLEFLNTGKSLAQKAGYKQGLKFAARLLAEAHAALGNYKVAYENQFRFTQLSDSLLNAENIKKVARLETSYTYEKKQDSLQLVQNKEKAVLAANIRQQKTAQRALGLGLGLSALLIITLALFYFSKRRSNRLLTLTNDQLLSLDNFKQQMMGMIVHDLKNPLNSIIGLSEKQNNPQFFNAINHSGKRMQTLIMNILDVQKLEESTLPLRKNQTSLNELLLDAVQQAQFITQEKKQTITTQIPGNLQVKVDHELVNRVFINLLTNASKFTPQNNPIHIQCEVVNNSFCKIMVKDTGVGIAAEHIEGIFDKFYQVNQKKTGVLRSTGLGLTFCKLAVEAHHGQIGVQSTPGQGSTFWFTLPLSKQDQVVSEPTIATIQDNTTPEVLSFTPKELGTLQPIAQQIVEFDIFETSNIVNALKPLNTEGSQNLQLWKKEIEDTLYTYNEVRFGELVNLVLD
ncbi:hypothetical protein BKI52_14190 [marine bacterium AO1-C]|nr:hypothetical protein BKI52_14190 [marine bacterium AO1-C]